MNINIVKRDDGYWLTSDHPEWDADCGPYKAKSPGAEDSAHDARVGLLKFFRHHKKKRYVTHDK